MSMKKIEEMSGWFLKSFVALLFLVPMLGLIVMALAIAELEDSNMNVINFKVDYKNTYVLVYICALVLQIVVSISLLGLIL